MTDAQHRRPTTATLLRRIAALSAPTTLLALVQVFVQLAETLLASRQGTAALGDTLPWRAWSSPPRR